MSYTRRSIRQTANVSTTSLFGGILNIFRRVVMIIEVAMADLRHFLTN